MKNFALLFIFFSILLINTSVAQTFPQTINYQGVLKDAGGNIVPNGTYTITFKLYPSETGGGELWMESDQLSVVNGVVNVQLGVTSLINLPFDTQYWLGIQISPGSELTPRIKLSSVPYSFMTMNIRDGIVSTTKILNYAVTLDKLSNNSVNSGKIVDGSITATDISNSQVVKSINTLKDDVTLLAGNNITITPSGNNLTITSTSSGGGTIGGSGTTDYIPKFTGATTIAASQIYESSGGLIGIGVVNPQYKLDVAGNARINTLQIGKGGGSISTNTALGRDCLSDNTTGDQNTAVGNFSLSLNTSGKYNTAVGSSSLFKNTTGEKNCGFGAGALGSNTTGGNSTALGFSTGWSKLNIDEGTFIGSVSDATVDDLNNVTAIGYLSRSTASYQVRIGNSSVTSIGGQVGWTTLSDGRYKTAVQQNVKGLDFIMKLEPVTYHLDVNKLSADLKEDQVPDENGNIITSVSETDLKARLEKSQITYTGFIAQDVEKAANETGFDFSGIDKPKNEHDFYGLRYAEFVVPLVKAVQEQQKIIEELTKRIAELEKK